MPTNVTSSSAPEYYFGCYKVCISFPQKYYNKGPPRDRSERQHGPENWQQSSQKAPTHVDSTEKEGSYYCDSDVSIF